MTLRRLWLAAYLVFLVLGSSWAISSPLLSSPDEPAHLVKSAAVVRGQLTGSRMKIADEGPGSIFRGGFTVVVDVPASYAGQTSEIPNCFIYEPRVPAGCAPSFVDDPTPATWTTWVGEYPPLYYSIVGLPTLLETGRLGVYLARLMSVAVSSLFLATAFACARASRSSSPLALGVVIAITPMVLFLIGSLNPNGLEIAAAVSFWTAFGAIVSGRETRTSTFLYLSALISALVLIASRPLSVVWLAVAFVILLLGFGSRGQLVASIGRRRMVSACALVGLAAAGALMWTYGLDALGNVQGDEPRGLGIIAALRHSAGRTPEFAREMVGVFGWRSTVPPAALVLLWSIALAGLVLLALVAASMRARLAVLASGAAALCIPVVMEAVQAHDRGFPWQGRYGLPLAVGVPITAALALRRTQPRRPLVSSSVVWAVVVATSVGQVLAHVSSMRRYVVGADGPLWYLSGDGWSPPLPPWLLLVIVVIGSIGLAALTVGVTLGGGSDLQPPRRSGGPEAGDRAPDAVTSCRVGGR